VTGQIVVIGLGNPILGDDGVGWRVAETVRERLSRARAGRGAGEGVEVDCCALGGLGLMERLVGYDSAIVIDALTTDQLPPGTLTCGRLEDLPGAETAHSSSAHDASLPVALDLGRRMGARLPATVLVVGIAAAQVYEFSEVLTPAVQAAVPRAAQAVLDLLATLQPEG
jgi:hydrogenase maturation protease